MDTIFRIIINMVVIVFKDVLLFYTLKQEVMAGGEELAADHPGFNDNVCIYDNNNYK